MNRRYFQGGVSERSSGVVVCGRRDERVCCEEKEEEVTGCMGNKMTVQEHVIYSRPVNRASM